ncbi:MAG: UPF0175 family protein [Verrucomicrobia bacterium]|nr:UPF0175 family protein [Verrucomicrobiota bacterium]
MKTVTVSTRLDARESKQIDSAAKDVGLDRASFLKQLIRRGFADVQFEKACEAYRRGDVTLSRAAEIARVSLHDMILRMPEADLKMNYDVRDLERDLAES